MIVLAAAATVQACRARLKSNAAEMLFLATLPRGPERAEAMLAVLASDDRLIAEMRAAERLIPLGSDGAEEGQP